MVVSLYDNVVEGSVEPVGSPAEVSGGDRSTGANPTSVIFAVSPGFSSVGGRTTIVTFEALEETATILGMIEILFGSTTEPFT